MDNFFRENRLIYKYKNPETDSSREDTEIAAEGINKGTYKDTKEAQDVLLRQSSLRRKLDTSDLLTDEDKATWEKKLKDAEHQAISSSELRKIEEDFTKQHGEIKGMVDQYTGKVMGNREVAFAIDATRDIDTAKDYVEWFTAQSYTDKLKALKGIDEDIDERKELRKKLLDRFDKKEIIKMRRSEMKDKVKELEVVENNLSRYKKILEKDKRLFHDINIYLEEFSDLTPMEQEDWIRRYEKEIAEPRRKLVEIHDSLPERFKNGKFFQIPSGEKRKYLEQVEAKIEREYIGKINKIPSKIWSDESKQFAIEDFRRLDDLATKAQWLEFLPQSIKAEEVLMERYSDSKFKEVRKLNSYSKKEWEKAKYEDKERMLKSMEAEVLLREPFMDILANAKKDNVISEKTEKRYIKIYNEMDLNGRRLATRNILYAMKQRRELMDDFEKLSPETQKKFDSFYKRGHKARLEIFKEAQIHEEKTKAKETSSEDAPNDSKENVPKSLEQNDIKEIIAEMQAEADNYEAIGQLEKALVSHQSVLKLNSEDQYSKRKIEQLQMEIDALETLTNESVIEAIEQEANTARMQEELKNIRLSQRILEDKERTIHRAMGNEDLSNQNSHLIGQDFDQKVHRELHDLSAGEKGLDKSGKSEKVQKIDLEYLGTRPNDTTQIKEDLRELGKDENLTNVQLVDSTTGRKLRQNEAKDQLEKRKKGLAREIAKDDDAAEAAAELIDEELEKEYKAA